MNKETLQELADEVRQLIENGIEQHSALNQVVGDYINLSMSTDDHVAFVREYAENQRGLFREPTIDIEESFDAIVAQMADNVLCWVLTEKYL